MQDKMIAAKEMAKKSLFYDPDNELAKNILSWCEQAEPYKY